METYIRVIGDENDGDDVESFSSVAVEDVEPLRNAINQLSKHLPRAGANGLRLKTGDQGDTLGALARTEIMAEKDIDLIREVLPYNEHGIHTLVSAKFYQVVSVEDLFPRGATAR